MIFYDLYFIIYQLVTPNILRNLTLKMRDLGMQQMVNRFQILLPMS